MKMLAEIIVLFLSYLNEHPYINFNILRLTKINSLVLISFTLKQISITWLKISVVKVHKVLNYEADIILKILSAIVLEIYLN